MMHWLLLMMAAVVAHAEHGEEDIKCPKGQVWNPCGSKCPPTCENKNPICADVCVPSCECPKGTFLNDEKKCLLEKECIFDPNFNPCGFTGTPLTDKDGNRIRCTKETCPSNYYCTSNDGIGVCCHLLPVIKPVPPFKPVPTIKPVPPIYPCAHLKSTDLVEGPDGKPIRVTIRKPGVCPRLPVDVNGLCVELCCNDYDCKGDKKCCSNGCGHYCTNPVKPDIICPKGQVWNPCGSQCPPTCENKYPICVDVCVARCECPKGTFLVADNWCVKEEDCIYFDPNFNPCGIPVTPLTDKDGNRIPCKKGTCPSNNYCTSSDGIGVCCHKYLVG